MKRVFFTLLLGVATMTAIAQQEIVYQVEEISVINYGDGRLLFRQQKDSKDALNGKHRIIDGYHSEYILADFKDGMYNGKYQHFRRGKIAEESSYKDGLLDGNFKRYHYDGVTVQSERKYINGKVDGISKTYFQNGKVETEKQYTLGVDNGYDRRYNSEGKLTMDQYYKDGKPDGTWIEHLSGNVGDMTRIKNYKNGLAEGEWSEVWVDGTPRNKGNYKEGKKDGVWISYRKNGQPEKYTTYKNDQKNGEEIIYFTDGKPEKSINYLNDKRDGKTRVYFFDSGKLKSEHTYKAGKENGEYKLFNQDGTLIESGRCENDMAVYRKEYYPNGKLKSVAERPSGSGGWQILE